MLPFPKRTAYINTTIKGPLLEGGFLLKICEPFGGQQKCTVFNRNSRALRSAKFIKNPRFLAGVYG